MATKLELCKNYLKSGRSLSPVEAMTNNMGMRLADLIYRMREEGIPVVTERHENPTTGEKYARYRLPRVGDRVTYDGSLERHCGKTGEITRVLLGGSNYVVALDDGHVLWCRAESTEPISIQ